MTARTWAQENKTILIYVDSYHQGTLQGRFYNPILNEGHSFESLSQFITKMEQILNGSEFPKAYSSARTFSPQTEQPPEPSGIVYEDGKLASFALRILFRQNASWQGSILWLDNNQEQRFRSVLELILLFDNALTQKQAS